MRERERRGIPIYKLKLNAIRVVTQYVEDGTEREKLGDILNWKASSRIQLWIESMTKDVIVSLPFARAHS